MRVVSQVPSCDSLFLEQHLEKLHNSRISLYQFVGMSMKYAQTYSLHLICLQLDQYRGKRSIRL